MRIALLAVALVVVTGSALFAYRAAVVFQRQYRDFHPTRAPMAAPLPSVAFALADGTRIAGWSLPSRNGVVVIFIHGSPGDRRGFLPLAESLHRAGYGALLLDMPGHGESGGEANWDERTREAVSAAIAQANGARVALFGYSMGSFIAAQVAANDRRVGALVLLAPFTELADQLRYQYRSRVPLVSEFAVLAARAAGVPVTEMRTLDALRAAPARPLLVIAGDRDSAVPVSMPRALHAAAPEPKAIWIVEGAGHVDLRDVAGPAVFDERIRAFLDKALFG
jgi:uncharacterized protein